MAFAPSSGMIPGGIDPDPLHQPALANAMRLGRSFTRLAQMPIKNFSNGGYLAAVGGIGASPQAAPPVTPTTPPTVAPPPSTTPPVTGRPAQPIQTRTQTYGDTMYASAGNTYGAK